MKYINLIIHIGTELGMSFVYLRSVTDLAWKAWLLQ